MWPGRLSSKQRQGQCWEQAARAYLQARGLVLVDANFACAGGEIDLIMRDGDELVFVEVRQRASDGFGGAAGSIGRAKQARIVNAAETYLMRFQRPPPCRIDVIAIDGHHIDWLQNAIEGRA